MEMTMSELDFSHLESPEQLADWLESLGIIPGEGEEVAQETAPAAKPRFVVDSPTKAEWVMEKLSEILAAQSLDEACYSDMVARAKAFKESYTKRYSLKLGSLMELLRPYALNVYEASKGKTKTVFTPAGELQIRQPNAEFTTTDADGSEAIAWLKANRDDLVRVNVELNRKEIKNQLVGGLPKAGEDPKPVLVIVTDTETGELMELAIPGLQAQIAKEPEFKAKVGDALLNYKSLFKAEEPRKPQEGGSDVR